MLFKFEHVKPILEGRKTQTRRTWKTPYVKRFHTYKAKTQMMSKEYFAKIKVMDIYQQRLGDITYQDANEEGYDSIESYKQVWERIFKMKWNPILLVWVIKFKVVK